MALSKSFLLCFPREFLVFLDLPIDFVLVVVVIGQRRMDLGQIHGRILLDDLLPGNNR